MRQVGVAGPRPSLLLINGLGAATEMWTHLEHQLTGIHLVEFDAPGTGRSQSPRIPLTIPALARLATQVLDELGVERADVLGYSMGGVVAQQLTIQSPERVRRLVLVATSVGLGTVPGTLGPMLNLTTPLRYRSPWFYRRTIGSLAGGRARSDPEWVRQHWDLRLRQAPSTYGYFAQLAGMTWSTLPFLADITQPTLVVAGDDDPLIPLANAALLTHGISHARGVVVAGEGHLMMTDDDSGAFAPIRDFLTSRTPDDSAAWRAGFDTDDVQLREAIRAASGQAQPWGLVSAAFRRAFAGPGAG